MTVRRAKPKPSNADLWTRFVALPENQSVLQALQRCLRWLDYKAGTAKPFPLLWIHGPSGTGKSHLLQATLERFIQQSDGKVAQILTAAELGQILTAPPGTNRQRLQELRNSDLLLIEDLQYLPIYAMNGLAQILDRRQHRSLSTIVMANLGPAELSQFPARLVSRFAGGLVVGLEPLAQPSRRALAEALCEQRGLKVTPAVLDWLAHSPGGARPILGELQRLEMLAKIHPAPLDLPIIQDQLPQTPAAQTSILERISERIALQHRIELKQLRGKARQQNILWPRQLAMYLGRQLTQLPLVDIGKFFGGRDHSTVLHACQKVEEQLKLDRTLAGKIREWKAELG